MKKYIYLMLSVVLAGVFSSCSKDEPFGPDSETAYGRLLTSALDVSLNSEYGPRSVKNRSVRAAAPSVNDFTVAFYKGDSESPEAVYKYKDMPEIVTLPVGDYTAKAFYGTNPDAAWDEPYYEGSTGFKIEEDEITDNVEPIVCKFANIRVSIKFNPVLRESMADDCTVTVVVGEVGKIVFTIDDVEAGKSAYFRYVEDSHTLAATLTGTVDGVPSTATKANINVLPGNHYEITFKLYDAGEEDPGSIVPGEDGLVNIDAEVTDIYDMNYDVDFGGGNVDDDLRPSEGEPEPDDPVLPDDPSKNAPTIVAQSPYDITLRNKVELVEDPNSDTGQKSKYPVVLEINSEAAGGIIEFKVTIDSDKITPDLLKGVGLDSELDLVNPGSLEEGLRGLNFPVGSDVKGQNHVLFDITDFVPLLPIYGAAEHRFVLTVRDANGITKQTFILYND